MFQAPVAESQERSEANRIAVAPEPQREVHPRFGMGTLCAAGSGKGGPRHHLAQLQKRIGNQAVLRMLSRSAPAIQTKLAINQPGDQYEQEADRVADHVMRMTAAPVIQRKCSACEEEGKVQRKCAECEKEEESTVQRKPASDTGGPLGEAPSSVHETLRSPGQPLDPAARDFFESRFGQDFSAVRVHDGPGAASSAQRIRARAYTVGHQIVFGAGQYNPSCPDGRQLIAHELAHVIQQGATTSSRPAAQPLIRHNKTGHTVQRDDEDAGAPPQPAPSVARELTADDEKSCSTLYLQKLCFFIEAGLNGDRSGPLDPPEIKSRNADCRKESGYPDSEPDVEISDAEKVMLRSPKCARGDPEAARRRAHDERVARILERASLKYVLGGAGQELLALAHDPLFIGSVAAAITAYVLLWIVPEPVFTKITAALTTIAILSTGLFSISVIKNLVDAWMDLNTDADIAQTPEQIDAAAQKFGSRIGATEADCLVFLASLLIGGKLPVPKGAPQAAEALAGAERALASPKPNGNVIEGPWGRASVKPAPSPAPSGPPPRAMFSPDGSPLKIEFFPKPEPLPAPAPEPVAPPAAARPTAPSRAPGTGTRPITPVVPGVKTAPDEQTPDSNSMRHQIQRGDDHFASNAKFADPKVGVTALQLRNAMSQNYSQFMSIAKGLIPVPEGFTRGPVRWEPAIVSAISRQSQKITEIVASGGVQGGKDFNALRQCFNPDSLAPSACASDDVRLDVENKGHNLRS